MDEIFEKVSFEPYNFRMTRLSARKSEEMNNFQGIKTRENMPVFTVYKVRLTMLCLSGFELCSRWVPLYKSNMKHGSSEMGCFRAFEPAS